VAESRAPQPSTAVATLAYLGLSAVFTHPLLYHLTTRVPLGAGDLWSNLWNFHWWPRALFELGTSPFRTDLIYHPSGISLAFHTHSPLNILATLPVSLSLGPEAAYNLAIFAGFPIAGLSTFLLLRELGIGARAAFVGGCIFAFSPMHFEQSLEHLNLASIGFVPLFLCFLLRVLRSGGYRAAAATGASFAATTLVCWQYGVIAALLGAVLVVRALRHEPRPLPELAADLGLAALLALLLVFPFAWPLAEESLLDGGTPVKPFEDLGTDLALWLVPSDHHPLFGSLTAPVYATARVHARVGSLAYLGWVPLGLAFAAAMKPRVGGRDRVFWTVLTLTFLLLSLGQHPRLLGHSIEAVTLPHAWFEQLPLLRMFRVANRFGLFAMLGIAVLAGRSLDALFRAQRGRLAWSLAAVIGLEFLWLPYPMRSVERHPYLEAIASQEESGAVLPIPLPVFALYSEAMYDQAHHRQPMVGGYVSYVRPEALESVRTEPWLASLVWKGAPTAELDSEALARQGVRTVLLHLDRSQAAYAALAAQTPQDFYAQRAVSPALGAPPRLLRRARRELEQKLGKPVFADERLLVFRVPSDSGADPGDP
jgi:hypothetical protein